MNMATDFLNLTIGDVLPAYAGRGIWAEPWEPAWFIFQVPPRGELPASAWLSRNGAAECWYPSETILTTNRYKPGKRIPKIVPVCSGYLFAVLPARPHWDVMFARAQQGNRKLLTHVVSRGADPIAIPESVIADMAQVPQRLETIREAEREARRIRPGDKARLNIGGTEWTVQIEAIHEGIASFVLPLLGGATHKANVEALRKA